MTRYASASSIKFCTVAAALCLMQAACGANAPAAAATNPNTSAGQNPSSATVVNFDTVLKNPATQACLTAAAADSSCQAALTALNQAETQLASVTSASQLSTDVSAFNSALAAVAQCASSANPNLTSPPPVGAGGSGCSVSVYDGVPTEVGDCTGCQIQQSNGSVSVTCDGSSDGTTGSGTTGTTGSGGTTGSTGTSSGSGQSGTCSAQVVNGVVQQSGDCTGCQINQSGDSVSVVCSGSTGGSTGSGTTGGSTGSGTTTGAPAAGSCSAQVVNGTLQESGDCNGCQVTQQGNSVSIVCSSN